MITTNAKLYNQVYSCMIYIKEPNYNKCIFITLECF